METPIADISSKDSITQNDPVDVVMSSSSQQIEAVPRPVKLSGFDFWRNSLKQAKYVIAPMVDQSELSWRLLCRRYGAQLCYTPMIHAVLFNREPKYRKENFSTCPEDRPLIAQFCANDPDILLQSAKRIEEFCDAIDINIGCPQNIAKRGRYGAYLQDEWDLLTRMVTTLHQNLSIPVTCKIRIFPDVNKTIQYAQMLERAGCQLLTVHGRTREQRGVNTGMADWDQIKAVKAHVKIPVFANGNVICFDDAEKCLEYTGVEGVMSAEPNLYLPSIFDSTKGHYPVWKMVEEYMEICEQYPTSVTSIRGHLFKLYIRCLPLFVDLREQLGKAKNYQDLKLVTTLLNDRIRQIAAESQVMTDEVPFWICQVYLRPHNPPNSSKKEENKQDDSVAKKRTFEQTMENPEEASSPILQGTESDEILSCEKRSKES
jgi:tRNA-dihydrouridine synthase 1